MAETQGAAVTAGEGAAPRILCIRLSALGDVLLCAPAFAGWAQAHPGGALHVLTRPAYAPLVTTMPGVARVWTAQADGASPPQELAALAFDEVFDLQGGLKGWRARRGLGPARVVPRRSLSRRWAALIHDPAGGDHPPRALDVAAGMGVAPAPAPLILPPERLRAAQALLPGMEPPVALIPGARWATKRAPPALWRAVAAALGERPLLWVGAPDEAPLLAACSRPGDVRHASADLLEAAAVLSRAAVAVAGDTGLLHLAEAVGTPVVGLYGPTVPGMGFGPRLSGSSSLGMDLPCRPCSAHGGPRCPQGHHRCLADLDPVEIAARCVARLTFASDGESAVTEG